MVKLIVCGSRNFHNKDLAFSILNKIHRELNDNMVLISGGALGADRLGELWAIDLSIPIGVYPADWEKYGRAAGPIRNEEMAKIGSHCVCFWDQKSRGSKNMIDLAMQYRLWLKVIKV